MPKPGNPRELQGPGGVLPLREGDSAVLDLAMLIEGETSGRPLDEVLARFGRSRSTYYEKLRRFSEEGLGGLLPMPTGPRGPWLRTQEVVARIVRARLADRARSAKAIAEELKRDGVVVSVRSIERTLSQFGLTERPPGQG